MTNFVQNAGQLEKVEKFKSFGAYAFLERVLHKLAEKFLLPADPGRNAGGVIFDEI